MRGQMTMQVPTSPWKAVFDFKQFMKLFMNRGKTEFFFWMLPMPVDILATASTYLHENNLNSPKKNIQLYICYRIGCSIWRSILSHDFIFSHVMSLLHNPKSGSTRPISTAFKVLTMQSTVEYFSTLMIRLFLPMCESITCWKSKPIGCPEVSSGNLD